MFLCFQYEDVAIDPEVKKAILLLQKFLSLLNQSLLSSSYGPVPLPGAREHASPHLQQPAVYSTDKTHPWQSESTPL